MKFIRFFFLSITLSLNIPGVYSQDPATALQAKVSLIQNVITKDAKPVAVISVSFINTSDIDIYIPEIMTVSKGKSGALIKAYSREGNTYKALPFYGGALPKLNLNGPMGNPISGYRNKIQRRLDSLYKIKHERENAQIREYSLFRICNPEVLS